MRDDDHTYYQRRAEVEAERAQQAATPNAAHAHARLAEAYSLKLTAIATRRQGAT